MVALELGLVVERIDYRPVPIPKEDVEAFAKPSTATTEILRGPTCIRRNPPVGVTAKFDAVLSPLSMYENSRQLRHSPDIPYSFARESAQIVRDGNDRLQSTPGAMC